MDLQKLYHKLMNKGRVERIEAEAGDKPLFTDSTMENYELEDVQYRNGSLWLNYKEDA